MHLKIEIPQKVSRRQEELLRVFNKEMKHSRGGIFGRLAKNVGTAFETIFGHGEDSKSSSSKDEQKKDVKGINAKGDSKDNDFDDNVEEKKTA